MGKRAKVSLGESSTGCLRRFQRKVEAGSGLANFTGQVWWYRQPRVLRVAGSGLDFIPEPWAAGKNWDQIGPRGQDSHVLPRVQPPSQVSAGLRTYQIRKEVRPP